MPPRLHRHGPFCKAASSHRRAKRSVPPCFVRVLVAAALIVLAIGGWALLRWRDTQRWNVYLDRLNQEPGVAVLSSGRRSGRFFVVGLRDPLARDPSTLIAGTGLLPDAVESRWEPYQALLPTFVTARATDLLRPPPGITLAFQDGTLVATGPASAQWIGDSERLAPALAGVRQFQHAGPEPAALLQQKLEGMTLHFPRGQAQLEPDQQAGLRDVERLLAELNATLRARGRRATVEIQGYTDVDGPDALNLALSQARADAVLSAINPGAFDALDFTARGVGPATPGREQDESVKLRDRRVSLRITIADAAGGSGRR